MRAPNPNKFLESVVALAYVLAKHTSRASKRLVNKLVLKCSAKPLRLSHEGRYNRRHKSESWVGEESFGDGGLWQRSILMGDKCQPLDFSGVIYYDCHGQRTSQPPAKSPMASPFVGYPGVGRCSDM